MMVMMMMMMMMMMMEELIVDDIPIFTRVHKKCLLLCSILVYKNTQTVCAW